VIRGEIRARWKEGTGFLRCVGRSGGLASKPRDRCNGFWNWLEEVGIEYSVGDPRRSRQHRCDKDLSSQRVPGEPVRDEKAAVLDGTLRFQHK